MKTFLPFFRANKMKMLVLGILAVTCMSFTMILTEPLPPADCTGSPSDGQECTGCHGDFPLNSGPAVCTITTNIPGGGYIPSTTYSVTVTMTQALKPEFQFELSPQNAGTGAYLGTLNPVAGNTALVGTKDIAGDPSTITNTGGQTWTFTWTAPATGLGPVTFYSAFNVSDNDGTESGDYIYTKSLSVSEGVPPPVSSASGTDATCNLACNGSATVTVTGGTSPYTYAWTGGQTTSVATGLCANNYTVLVTDAVAGTSTSTVAISQPTAITTTTSVTNVSCFGGNNGDATASASGGTGTISYSWNTIPVQNTATATGLIAGNYVVTATDANTCTNTATVTITEPATAVTASVTASTDVLCKGSSTGDATAAGSGGTGAFTYLWSTTPAQSIATATGLAAGDYTATVTDANGCSTTATVTITEPATAVTASVTAITPASCGSSDGDATVTASGGTGTLTYLWDATAGSQTTTTATGLAAAGYTVDVTDANGCVTSTVATVSNALAATVSVTATTDVTCNGGNDGSATATASGGTGTLTYSWNTIPPQTTLTATGLSAGTYNLTVTDAVGCITIVSAIINEPAAVTAPVSITNVNCNGGSDGTATATAIGGTGPYTYVWNSIPAQSTATATGLTAGSYTCSITDFNGCTGQTTATITEPAAALTTTMSSTDQTVSSPPNGSATATPSGGTAPYTYAWVTTPVQTTPTATGLIGGTYTVAITDANGCSLTNTVVVLNTVSVVSLDLQNAVKVFPNPNSGEFNVELNSAVSNDYTIELRNLLGQIIYNEELKSFSGKYSKRFDVKAYGVGLYMINVHSNDKQLLRKIVVY